MTRFGSAAGPNKGTEVLRNHEESIRNLRIHRVLLQTSDFVTLCAQKAQDVLLWRCLRRASFERSPVPWPLTVVIGQVVIHRHSQYFQSSLLMFALENMKKTGVWSRISGALPKQAAAKRKVKKAPRLQDRMTGLVGKFCKIKSWLQEM